MNIGCIVQARNTSSRLPGKILLKLPCNSETTVLGQVIERVRKSKYVNQLIVATTINNEDDSIVDLCNKLNTKYFRGSEDDVLERFYHAAKKYNLDVIIRITSDCPCIDWEIIDRLILIHLKNKNDYTSNTLKRSFPHGLDAEVFNFDILEEMENKAKEKFEREHVTPYIYKINHERFKIENLMADQLQHGPQIRITLDTKEDYNALCAVYDLLFYQNQNFVCSDIVKLYNKMPWLKYLNNNINQKKICNSLKEELEETIRILKNQDLFRAVGFIQEKITNE